MCSYGETVVSPFERVLLVLFVFYLLKTILTKSLKFIENYILFKYLYV